MKHIFKSEKKPSTLEQNKINGKSAERYFAASITIALNARVFWATRTEDDSKVDLISVITHPWLINRVEVVFTQVKSGPTFCEVDNNMLNVNKEKFNHLTGRNHHTLVCWTHVDKGTPYWFLIKANCKFFRTKYSENHLLSPASRYDIVRTLVSTMTKDGGKGLIFKRKNLLHRYDINELRKLRSKAKEYYKQLQNTELHNPLFGIVDFTRLGWRHITRDSRLNIYKIASYEVMSIVNCLISKTPSKHFCLNSFKEPDGKNELRECEYVLEYDNVICYDSEAKIQKKVKVYIKILEFVYYNSEWRSTANSSNEIQRRVIFKSIYYK